MQLRILSIMDTTACPGVLDPLRDIAEVETATPTREALRERIRGVDALLTWLSVRVDRDILERADRLRAVATPSTGLDHIDVEEAACRGIAILSLKEDRDFLNSITATAELAWALLLAVVRRLPAAAGAAARGDWARDRFRGHQLSGRTLGILGYGRLGRMVAEYGKAFRMQVLACDVRDVEMAPGVQRVPFDRLLRDSDILSIHIHLTDANRGLLDAAALARMKPGAILINTSRGAIVNEAALLRALEEGRLGGAGLDVIEGEWRTDLDRHPLVRYAAAHENLVITPHVGGVTFESQAMAQARCVEKLLAFLKGAQP